jgi:electron transport complex protein RnfD
MGFIRKTSPYLRDTKTSVTRMMRDVVIAMTPALAFSIYQFKASAVAIILVSVITMMLTEYLYTKSQKTEFTLKNWSAGVSAIIYALILPNETPLLYVAIGGFVGIYFGKLIFGGLGVNIFNPAALARVFVTLSFGSHLSYTLDGQTGATPLAQLGEYVAGTSNELASITDLFFGTVSGSLGETNALLVLLGGIYLLIRKSADWRIPTTILGTVFVLATTASLVLGFGMDYVWYHLLSGGLLFGAFFMATDPVTGPTTPPSRVMFGIGVGALTFFIRTFGALPEGFMFSLLIMNMFVPAFDYYEWTTVTFTRKKMIGLAIVSVILIVVTYVGAGSLV